MKKKRLPLILCSFVLMLFLLSACTTSTEPTEVTRVVEVPGAEVQVTVEVPVEVTRIEEKIVTETVVEGTEMAPLGSEDHPIQLLFVPSVDADVIVSGGDVLKEELQNATGLHFDVSVPTSYAATIEAICASPADTMAFLPALGYVLANERCGVQVGNAAVRFGWSVYWSQIIVPADSDIETLEDLAGKTWGAPSVTSTSGYLVPFAQLSDAGIETGEVVETGGHTAAMLAVYNGDVDFATGFFSPPLLPDEMGRRWNPDTDDPEIWRESGNAERNEAGRVFVNGGPSEGGYRVLDARAGASETAPDIFEATRILTISDPIPNDTVSFGAEFPLGLSKQIIDALADYASSDACQEPAEGTVTLCSDEFYGWTGAEPVSDAAYDPTRFIMQALNMSEEDILGE